MTHDDDDLGPRRPINGNVTSGEVARWMERHVRESDRNHRDMQQLIDRLDARTDAISTRVTQVFTVVAVLWAIFLVIAPVLRNFLGLGGN